MLAELREYAAEVDVDFVRKSVRTIGRLAIKLERRAEKCVQELMKLIQTKVNYVVQEAVIVIKDVFRKYPNRYEGVIGALCDALGTLDEPEAKASMVRAPTALRAALSHGACSLVTPCPPRPTLGLDHWRVR